MNILAFDLGASGGRLFLAHYDNNFIDIQMIHQFEHRPEKINDCLYWNIFSIYNEMITGIKKALQITNDNIDSFGIDSFCNDFALINTFGELLSPIRCYRDKRTSVYAQKIYKDFPPAELYRMTGNQNALFNTFMQLAAISHAGYSGLVQTADKLLFIPDLLIYFLTGKFITEYTLASVSQLFDYQHYTWHPRLMDYLKLSPQKFGTLTAPGTIIGKTQPEFNKSLNTLGFSITAVCEHDTASAFLSACSGKTSAIISSGTWAIVGIESTSPIVNDLGFKYNIATEGGFNGHYRILKNVMGTWILQEIRNELNTLGQNYTFSDLEDMATKAQQKQWIIDIDHPDFYQPGNMIEKVKRHCMAAYHQDPSTLNDILRCVYESLSQKYSIAIKQLEEVTHQKITDIYIIGGGSKSALQCQLTADACGLPVTSGPSDAAGYGNIMVQFQALMPHKSFNQIRSLFSDMYETKHYEPRI